MGLLDRVTISGPERERVLAEIRRQMAAWDLTLPEAEPLALDFGLGRFREIGETEFWIANEEKAGYCGKFLFVFDGQTCPYHCHKVKHETFFVMKGQVKMIVDGRAIILRQGDRLVMPVGTKHSFTGQGPALLLEVSMPSVPGDSYFDDPQIGDHGLI